MRFLHTMLRVRNLDAALHFYCNLLGLQEVRRRVDEKNRYTLVFLAAPEDVPAAKAALDGRPADAPMRRADLQLGHRGLRRGALLRPPRLRGRRHLCHLRQADEGRRHHQPAAARRQHGVRALARQAFDRAAAEGQAAAAEGALGLDAQHRQMVRLLAGPAPGLYTSRRQMPALLASPSSSGLGHHPFTVKTGVRFPVGTPPTCHLRCRSAMVTAGTGAG